MNVQKLFYETMIERVRCALKSDFKTAQKTVDFFKKNCKKEYEKQLNSFFDEIHPF